MTDTLGPGTSIRVEAGEPPWEKLAGDLGLPSRPAPIRRWVQSPNAGHLSGLVWGAVKSEVVFVHDLGDSANGWDAVALALGLSLVAIDLAGHGRSSVAKAIAPPARQSPALIDAVRSLAPTARLVVATGFGAATTLQAAVKRPGSFPALLVIDGGPVASGLSPLVDPDGFDDVDAVAARLTLAAPGRHPAFVRHLAEQATVPDESGRLAWRYQLGALPDDYDDWTSPERVPDPPIPVGVVTAGEPHDHVVRTVLARRPQAPRYDLGEHPGHDLIGTAPAAVADAIRQFLADLDDVRAERSSTAEPATPSTVTPSTARSSTP